MKKPLKILLLVGTLGLFTVGCDRSPENMAEKITKKVSKKLDLNEDQKVKLNKIKEAMLKEYLARKDKKDERKAIFQEFVRSDKLEKAKVKEHMDKRKDDMYGKFDKYFPLIQDFHASLSKEQKEKVIEISNKIHKKYHKRW